MAYLGVSPSNGVRKVHTYTATASQTTFSGAGAENISLSYRDSTYIDVYQNGVKLGDADYTATSGTSVVLGTGATASDIVVIVVYDVFSVADTVSKTDGGQFDGNVTMAGTLGVTGAVTANAGVVVDNITIDGTEIDLSSGNLTLDVDGAIILDADAGQVQIHDAGTEIARFTNNSSDFEIKAITSDKDIRFKGNDGGSEINALTLDMSDAGTATFNHDVILSDNSKIKLGDSGDLELYHDGSNSYVDDTGTGRLYLRGNDRVQIQKYTGEDMVTAIADGAVNLYYDNAKKLETVTGGVTVSGTCTATTFSGSGASLTNLPASGPFQSAPVEASTSSTVSVGTSYTTIVQVAITHDANDKVIIFANFQLDTQSSSTSGQGDFRILATNTSQSAELNVNDILAESARLRWQEAYIARDSRGISATTTYYIQVRKTNGTMNVNHGNGTSRILLFLETV